jgi:hypothetical protein
VAANLLNCHILAPEKLMDSRVFVMVGSSQAELETDFRFHPFYYN